MTTSVHSLYGPELHTRAQYSTASGAIKVRRSQRRANSPPMPRLRTLASPVPGVQIAYDFVSEAEEQYLLQVSPTTELYLWNGLTGARSCRESMPLVEADRGAPGRNTPQLGSPTPTDGTTEPSRLRRMPRLSRAGAEPGDGRT